MIICIVCNEVKPHGAHGLCKHCYNNQYYAEHADEIAAHTKQYHIDNADVRNARSKQYDIDNADVRNAYFRQYRKDHADSINAYNRQYHREHPNEIRNYVSPAGQCVQLNRWFEGCNRHHVDPETIIHIPAEIHNTYYHNIKTGKGMNRINELAYAFLCGQRGACSQTTISEF